MGRELGEAGGLSHHDGRLTTCERAGRLGGSVPDRHVVPGRLGKAMRAGLEHSLAIRSVSQK